MKCFHVRVCLLNHNIFLLLLIQSPFIQSYAMYNDQEPSGKKAAQTKAHSKGWY